MSITVAGCEQSECGSWECTPYSQEHGRLARHIVSSVTIACEELSAEQSRTESLGSIGLHKRAFKVGSCSASYHLGTVASSSTPDIAAHEPACENLELCSEADTPADLKGFLAADVDVESVEPRPQQQPAGASHAWKEGDVGRHVGVPWAHTLVMSAEVDAAHLTYAAAAMVGCSVLVAAVCCRWRK